MDPTVLASSFLSGAGKGLTGGAPASSAVNANTAFDSSGWNVNFGAGTIDSERSQAGNFDRYIPYALAAVGLVVAWRLTRKRG